MYVRNGSRYTVSYIFCQLLLREESVIRTPIQAYVFKRTVNLLDIKEASLSNYPIQHQNT